MQRHFLNNPVFPSPKSWIALLLALPLLSVCRPTMDSFPEVLKNYKQNGFLHPHLYQTNCQAASRPLGTSLDQIREDNRRRALKSCRLLTAFLWSRFQRTNSTNNAWAIPHPAPLLESNPAAAMESLRLTDRQQQSLLTQYKPLLGKMYVAREQFAANGDLLLTVRVWDEQLVDKILDTNTLLQIKVNKKQVR
jgi:hypothetical protein